MNRVLVTGATGLIGRAVVRQLRRRGVPTRVLVRDPERLDRASRTGVEVCRGELGSIAALREAASEIDTVLHLAAHARAWSRDPAAFSAVNGVGVGNLLAAIAAAGVRRLVHVSTVLCHPALAGRRKASRRLTAYEETKFAGDRLVDAATAEGLDAVTVYPTRVYGPGPLGPSNGVTRLVELAISRPVIARLADRGALANYVHVEDVAAGILLAAERGQGGGRYLLGGENATVEAILDRVAELSDVRPPVIAIPAGAAIAAGHLAVALGRLGLEAPFTPDWVRMFLEDHSVDITPTRRALGYAPRSLRDGLAETIQWLRCRCRPAGPLGSPLRA